MSSDATKPAEDAKEMVHPSEYKEGEKVLAYHGPLLYEAKIQKTELRRHEWKYFVHYLGWSKNWDEWVGIDRLLPFTAENVKKQAELENSNAGEKPRKGRISQPKQKGSTGSKGRRRKREEKDGEESAVKVSLPPELRKQLFSDCESVTQAGKLTALPRKPNVEEILRRYVETQQEESNSLDEKAMEIVNGISVYFDRALPLRLLYRQEREQYEEIFPGNSSLTPALVYGAEHLLRLFVKLPELVSGIAMEEDAILHLNQRLADIIRFLQKNQSTFFAWGSETAKQPDALK